MRSGVTLPGPGSAASQLCGYPAWVSYPTPVSDFAHLQRWGNNNDKNKYLSFRVFMEIE